MRKKIIYIAHPVSTGNAFDNAMKAVRWTKWFVLKDPSRIYVAPWVAEVLSFVGDDLTSDFYQRVLDDDCAVIARMNGVVGVGGEGWTKGMGQERATIRALNGDLLDLTQFNDPSDVPEDFDLSAAWEAVMVPGPRFTEPY